MNKISNKATFFGSGPVAAESLKLLNEWLEVELVVTKQTPAHHKETAPVEDFAKQNGLTLAYANNKSELDNLASNDQLPKTNYGIVIDYGVIISQSVIDFYTMGIINSHFSLLPEWRGADPITFSLLSGQSSTGVSIMLIDKGLDTGMLLGTGNLIIDKADNNTTITSKLINLSNALLKDLLPAYLEGTLKPYSQPNTIPTYSVKISKQDGLINVNKPSGVITREIMAFNPWPGSRLQYKQTWLTITQATPSDYKLAKGQLEVHDKKLYLGCNNSSLEITEIKPAGKNKMSASAFINGYAHIFK